MAPDLEMGAGSGTGVGFGFPVDPFSPSPPSVSAAAANSYLYGLPPPSSDVMRVDDLLDFSTHTAFYDSVPPAAPDPQHYYGFPQQPELAPASSADLDTFPFDLRIPSEEEAAELEWLSRFVEDSFSFPSSATAFNPSAAVANPNVHCNIDDLSNYSIVDPSAFVHGRPRTKRTRPVVGNPAIHAAWTALTPQSPSSSSSSSSEPRPRGARKDREAGEGGTRKCTHCASEKTPQWRTGPLGPKTLCNACGVRYKSGRLVPEYRPAASPTFVLTQHSNSHRKVMELRRQKEVLVRHQQAAFLTVPSGGATTGTAASSRPDMLLMDYEVC